VRYFHIIWPYVATALIAGAAVFFLACGKSRSDMIKDVPKSCGLILEEAYYSDGKSQVVAGMLGETCKGMTIFEYCDKRIKDNFPKLKTDSRDYDREYKFCTAKLGK